MATSGHSDMTTLIRTKRARNVFLPVNDALTGFYGTGKGRLYRTQDPGEKWDLIWSKPGTSDQRPRRARRPRKGCRQRLRAELPWQGPS